MTIILPDNRKPQPPASVLRGPADAGSFRVKVKRSRWYADPLPACDIAPSTDAAWPSVSAVKKAKPFAFGNYTAMKRIARAANADGVTLGRGFDQDYALLKMIDGNAMTLAQNRGKHVHSMFEQCLYGQTPTVAWRDPDTGTTYKVGPGADYLPAIVAFFDTYQPELVAAEFVCIHRDLNGVGYGGTADAALKIEGGIYKVDWKSRDADGDHAAYAEEGAQIALYARAQYAIADAGDGTAKRIPVPRFDGGLIASIKPEGVRLYPVDLDKAWDYGQALHAFWVADLTCDAHTGKPWAAKTVAVERERGASAPAADGGVEADVAASASPADPFDGLVTQDVTPSLATKPYVVPVPADVPVWTATPAPEGDEVDAKTVWRLTEGYKRRDAVQRTVMRELLKEAQRAGVPFGQVEKNPTMRRFELGRALLAVADHALGGPDLDDALVRACFVLVLGDRPEVAHAPIGALLGCLDPDEARTLVRVLEGVSDGTYVADFSTGSLLLKQRAA